ncbi:MAG TPA: hypothetical protein VF790_09305 [Dissulfurispiraceae bacterium]
MKGLMRRLEDLMIAVTFAEAGEHGTVREVLAVEGICPDEDLSSRDKKSAWVLK